MGDSLQPICLIDDDSILVKILKAKPKIGAENVETFNNFEEVRKAKNLSRYSCFVVDYDLGVKLVLKLRESYS